MRWGGYVNRHVEFEERLTEVKSWLDGVSTRLNHCSDLSSSSQQDLEAKLETIQVRLLSIVWNFNKFFGFSVYFAIYREYLQYTY